MDKFQKKRLVLAELSKLPFHKIVESDVLIYCPFHEDVGTPNCYVNINPNKRGKKGPVPVGTFNCWRCKSGGVWGKLAAKLKLSKFEEESYEEENAFDVLSSELDEVKAQAKEDFIYAPPAGLEAWGGEWRGLPESFLRSVGAKEWYDRTSEAYRIWFPITHLGQLEGHVAGRLDKETQPKYRNSVKLPVKKLLFLADLIKGDKVVLVEGPFDALRLQHEGIPSASILGVPHWGEEKLSSIIAYGFRNILVLGDSDSAGYNFNMEAFHDLQYGFNVDYINLPLVNGEPIDPGSMGLDWVNTVKKILDRL